MTYPLPGASGQPGVTGQGIWLNLRASGVAAGITRHTPRLEIDGYVVPVTWGETIFPLAPGRHRIHVHVPAGMPARFGPADFEVDVYPGVMVPVEYRPPIYFGPGAMGFPPQRSRNVGCFWALMAFPILTVIAMLLILLLVLLVAVL